MNVLDNKTGEKQNRKENVSNVKFRKGQQQQRKGLKLNPGLKKTHPHPSVRSHRWKVKGPVHDSSTVLVSAWIKETDHQDSEDQDLRTSRSNFTEILKPLLLAFNYSHLELARMLNWQNMTTLHKHIIYIMQFYLYFVCFYVKMKQYCTSWLSINVKQRFAKCCYVKGRMWLSG